MACKYCKENWFWKKIGRCKRCMDQLTVLSVLCWVIWWFAFRDDFKSVESIALIIAGFGFNFLLFLHLWFKFVVFPMQKKSPLNNRRLNFISCFTVR
ncbi:DUF3624 domain-containing protein [Vibrio algarum]|uniref:DUF3624 domain-containing protein n=1 Tax=Vibrio algarum TaxID=3020714 RepID=A0ABT4YMK2_9VIBR|nr:DUF3624 domain-containing protein [Vibrio sp. KJ40-1]MDB1122784.1 DUF3624 domain-containing protein [Vibrio sp. KJ40-1]